MTTETAEPTTPTQLPEHVLFFDGVCGFCNKSINFVMERDRQGTFRFAPLQGITAEEFLSPEIRENLDSVVYARGDERFTKSAAAVRVLWQLGGIWWLLGSLLWLIPKPLRDLGYNGVAKVRYRLFGKHDTCRIPTPEERDRFLD